MDVMETLREIWPDIVSFAKEWGELLFSGLAFFLSVIAMIRASKAEKMQNKINALELKIKQYELDRIAKEQAEAELSCVEARVVTVGNGKHRLKVWNSGNTTVYNVSAKFEGDPNILVMDDEKQPFDQLDPRKGYELSLLVYSGSASKFKIITEWTDADGKTQQKSQMGDL